MTTHTINSETARAERQWQEAGREPMSRKQQKMLNAACSDLAEQLNWHGNRLDKDDWRHLIAGTVLGWRMMPAYDTGEGAPGFIMLGGSSLSLSKTQATDAITMAFHIGDFPDEQRLRCRPVRWCAVVCLARYIVEDIAA
jgi:hypothetical protein